MICFVIPLYPTYAKGLIFQGICATTSCVVATCYHYALYRSEEQFLGLSKDHWRELDVVIACYCLPITLQYMVHAEHIMTTLLTRVIAIFIYYYIHTNEDATLRTLARVVIAISGLVLIGKLVLPVKRKAIYNLRYAKYAIILSVLAFVFFPLPVIWPHMYWLYHSLWHIFFGSALFVMYGFLHTGKFKKIKKA